MINLAVINVKDIVKYLVKVTIVITIVVALTRYFSSFKTKVKNSSSKIKNNSFLYCLDEVLPNIKSVNNNVAETKENIELLKMALSVEMPMIDSIVVVKQEESQTTTANKSEVEQEKVEIEEAKTGLETEVQESNVPAKYTNEYNGVKIKNETDIKLTEQMLIPDITINKENILIYHTHSCESYTSSEKYTYKQTGNYRTTDKNYSVIRVGTELKKYLNNYGYNVIHDQTLYDYPSYSGSYDRSLAHVSELLKENEGTQILFDIHRDAIGDSSYAPTVKIGDEYAAQLLFVMGSNGSGDKHDAWLQNLKFVIKIQEKANELYPGLFKPIILRNSRYNQQLAKGCSILEVGATGNTLDQCLVSMKYLSKVIDEVLK